MLNQSGLSTSWATTLFIKHLGSVRSYWPAVFCALFLCEFLAMQPAGEVHKFERLLFIWCMMYTVFSWFGQPKRRNALAHVPYCSSYAIFAARCFLAVTDTWENFGRKLWQQNISTGFLSWSYLETDWKFCCVSEFSNQENCCILSLSQISRQFAF